MKIFVIIMMFLATTYGISEITKNGRVVQVSEVTTKSYLTTAATLAIAFVTAVYDLALLYFLMTAV